MNDKYLHELRSHLRCSRKTKNRLLEQFTAYQRNTIDDTPDYDQIVNMFGPPEEMARTLMEEITSEEQTAYAQSKLVKKIVTVLLATAFVLSSLYVMFWKEMSVVEVETNTYYGEPNYSTEEIEVAE